MVFRIKKDDGKWTTEENEISEIAIQSFKDQLNGNHTIGAEHLLQNIPNLVTSDQNEMLASFPTMDELHNTIISMNQDSAAGPDGFNGYFYQTYWEIIKYEFLCCYS